MKPARYKVTHLPGFLGSVLICLFGLLLCLTVGAQIGTCQALPRARLSSGVVLLSNNIAPRKWVPDKFVPISGNRYAPLSVGGRIGQVSDCISGFRIEPNAARDKMKVNIAGPEVVNKPRPIGSFGRYGFVLNASNYRFWEQEDLGLWDCMALVITRLNFCKFYQSIHGVVEIFIKFFMGKQNSTVPSPPWRDVPFFSQSSRSDLISTKSAKFRLIFVSLAGVLPRFFAVR